MADPDPEPNPTSYLLRRIKSLEQEVSTVKELYLRKTNVESNALIGGREATIVRVPSLTSPIDARFLPLNAWFLGRTPMLTPCYLLVPPNVHNSLPPVEWARYDSDGLGSRNNVPQSSNIDLPRRKPGQSDDRGLTIVTDEYIEDIGEPILDDCEFLINPTNPASTSRHTGYSRHNPHGIPDGEGTKILRESVRLAPENLFDDPQDPDPIKSFEQPKQERTQRGQSVITRRVQAIEKKTDGNQNKPAFPRLNLLEHVENLRDINQKNVMTRMRPTGKIPFPSKLGPPNKPPEKFLPIKVNVSDRRILRDQTINARWDVANRVAQLANTVSRNSAGGVSYSIPTGAPAKAPAVRGIPPLDNWSPPRAAMASSSRRQGSPEIIELDWYPPRRPKIAPSTSSGPSGGVAGPRTRGTKRKLEGGADSSTKRRKH
ncbi:hypothetical protein C8R44DRAFT_771509 [Mycena epipterygia]|nr:hypothetical protein C8R44DRAFT_771509 [Mycena epipterygia]